MPKPLRTSAGTWLKRSSGGYVRRTGDPVRSWLLENSLISATSILVDIADWTQAAFANALDGAAVVMRGHEMITKGHVGPNGELASWVPGATAYESISFGFQYTKTENYYAGKVLVQEIKEGLFDNSVNLSMGTPPSSTTTLDRHLNVTETGDGVQTLFTVSATTGQAAGTTARQLRVYVDGVRLAYGTDYSVADNGADLDVTFASAPANGAEIRIYSVRKEFTISDPPNFHANWTIRISGNSNAVVSNLRQSLYWKEHEDELYAAEPYRRINPGYRTYLDHCDVLRTMDPHGRIMLKDQVSLSQVADINSGAINGEDDSYADDSPWTVTALSRKTGVPFDVYADYCENGAPSGHKKILWYHVPVWMTSPVRKSIWNDRTSNINRGWFGTANIDVSSLILEKQVEKGSVSIDATEGYFEFDPFTDAGGGVFYQERRTSDGTTNPQVIVGEAGRTDLVIHVETGVGTNAWNELTEGVDYTLADNGADLEVTFTSVPENGVIIRFGFPNTNVQFVCSAVDPLDSVRKHFIVPLTVLDAEGSNHVRAFVRGGQVWQATDAGLGVNNIDWFSDEARWRRQGELFVDMLVNSTYSTTRPLYLAIGNEVWNQAADFNQDQEYCDGVGLQYGQNGAAGLGILLGYFRRAVEDELASRSLSYNIKWMAESWAANAPTTTDRFQGHAYFWENVEGLTAQDALAKNADLIPAIAMYVGGGFKNNVNNLPQIVDSDKDPVTTDARDYVLGLLAQGGQALEDAYINDWMLRASPVSVSTLEWNMQQIRAHHANAVANGGNGDFAFYEGWTHEDAFGSIPGLNSDDNFKAWFIGAMMESLGARVWREMADAIIAEFPNAVLSHYTGPRDASFNNPWGVGPWELPAKAAFAVMRDEYGPKADIF